MGNYLKIVQQRKSL